MRMRPFVLTFADAIERFGVGMSGRAGRAFANQLKQHLVFLKNDHQDTLICPSPVSTEAASQAKSNHRNVKVLPTTEALMDERVGLLWEVEVTQGPR
jgi:hypothetical protein